MISTHAAVSPSALIQLSPRPLTGTFVSAFTVLCGARTDLPDRHVCCVFWLNIAAALIQILTAIVMVGWIMSIFWGMDMVILASEWLLAPRVLVGPRGLGGDEESRAGGGQRPEWSGCLRPYRGGWVLGREICWGCSSPKGSSGSFSVVSAAAWIGDRPHIPNPDAREREGAPINSDISGITLVKEIGQLTMLLGGTQGSSGPLCLPVPVLPSCTF